MLVNFLIWKIQKSTEKKVLIVIPLAVCTRNLNLSLQQTFIWGTALPLQYVTHSGIITSNISRISFTTGVDMFTTPIS